MKRELEACTDRRNRYMGWMNGAERVTRRRRRKAIKMRRGERMRDMIIMVGPLHDGIYSDKELHW